MEEWRVLLTTGSDWREAGGMSKWDSDRAKDVKAEFVFLPSGVYRPVSEENMI